MLTHSMFWRAIDNLAAAKNISCSRMAQISGLDITALNKSKRIGSDGKNIGCRLAVWQNNECDEYQLD